MQSTVVINNNALKTIAVGAQLYSNESEIVVRVHSDNTGLAYVNGVVVTEASTAVTAVTGCIMSVDQLSNR